MFRVLAAWRTDYQDPGWEEELKSRIRDLLVERGERVVGDFAVEPTAHPNESEWVRYYTALIEVAGVKEGFSDLSSETVKRPKVAGPKGQWAGLLDAQKQEIQAEWYSRVPLAAGKTDFLVPEGSDPCSVSYWGEYLEAEGGAALRVHAVEQGEQALVIQPDAILSVY